MQKAHLPTWSGLTMALAIAGHLMLVAACAEPRRAGKPPPGPPKPNPRPITVGKVTIVNEEKRFVLIDLASNLSIPDPGVALRTMNGSEETGQLRAAPERKRPFMAADIVSGHPTVGDRVVQ